MNMPKPAPTGMQNPMGGMDMNQQMGQFPGMMMPGQMFPS